MSNQDLKEKILQTLEAQKTGVLATVRKNRPYSRYMNFYNEDLTLYTASNKETHKVEDINENPNVHILIGYEGNGIGDTFLEIEGKAEASESSELKEKLWKSDFDKWFSGKDDPEYIVLKIKPEKIRFMNAGSGKPEKPEELVI